MRDDQRSKQSHRQEDRVCPLTSGFRALEPTTFRLRDAHGLNLGRAVGTNTWNKAQTYFLGIAVG